jgi:hypothetical protein
MRLIIIFSILFCSQLLLGQDSNSVFDNNVKLKEGIYTSLSEIIENSPKYFDCIFETKVDFWFGQTSTFYHDKSGIRHELNDTILLVVEDGEKYVHYNSGFYRLIRTGAISTFIIETLYVYSMGYRDLESNLYFWDLQTGMMDKLNPANFDEIIKRDNSIYSTYSGISKSQKKKTLYYYVLKYNEHNPIYIQHYE